MKVKGKMWLKYAGGLAVAFGLIMVFLGFYIMASGMTLDSISPDDREAQMKLMKLISLGGFYVMANGGFHCVAGFMAILNAANLELAEKCRNFAWILVGLVVADIIILSIAARTVTVTGTVAVVIPLLIAVLYTIGAQINVKQAKQERK